MCMRRARQHDKWPKAGPRGMQDLGLHALSEEKSRPGGMTLMRGMQRPMRRRERSTRSSFTSYLQQRASKR